MTPSNTRLEPEDSGALRLRAKRFGGTGRALVGVALYARFWDSALRALVRLAPLVGTLFLLSYDAALIRRLGSTDLTRLAADSRN